MVKRLLFLNGVAIIAAVLYHTSGWGFTALFWWTDRYSSVVPPNFDQIGGGIYYLLRFLEQLVIFAIPAFLFVSGYFIAVAAGRSQKSVSWKLIRSRIQNLVIPFVLWSVLILMAKIIQGETYSPFEFLTTIVLGRTEAPFYFVPVLIQLYLISPFLVPLARKHWKLLLMMTFILQSTVVLMRYDLILSLDIPWLKPFLVLTRSFLIFGNVFWFTLGMVVGFHLETFKTLLVRFRWLLFVAMIVFFCLGMYEWESLLAISGQDWIAARETFIDNMYSLALLGTYIAFDHVKYPLASYFSSWGSRSFGIYLIHSSVLEFSARLIYHFAPALLGVQIILLPILFTLGFGIPLLLMEIVNRSPARKYYGYLFG